MSGVGDHPGAGAASGTAVDAAPDGERYNLAELQRCIAFSFSAGEMSKLAERFGVFVDREAGADKGARALVKAMDARGQVGELVASLHQAKPLVEWPEPQRAAPSADILPAAWAGEPNVPPPSPPPADEVAPKETKASAHTALPLTDPYAEMDAEPPPSQAFPRWAPWAVMFAGGLLLGGIATWWIARDDDDEPSAARPDPNAPGLGSLAAGQMRQTVTLVAKACDAPTRGDSARNVLTEAFRRCATPTIRPGVDQTPPLPPPKPPPPEPLQPLGAQPLPKGPPNAACLDSCHRLHAECKQSECGPEPESSKQYADYQRCLNVCLTKYSQCRMRCR